MKSITSILTVLALGASIALAADPAKPKPNPAAVFKKLDANADGKISAEEWKASPQYKKDATKAEAAFGKKDKDGDKNLSLEEFSATGKKR